MFGLPTRCGLDVARSARTDVASSLSGWWFVCSYLSPRVRPPPPPWVLIQLQMSPAVCEHLPGVLSVPGTEDTAVTRSALIQEPYVPVGEPDVRQISVKSTTGSHTRVCTWLCVCVHVVVCVCVPVRVEWTVPSSPCSRFTGCTQ